MLADKVKLLDPAGTVSARSFDWSDGDFGLEERTRRVAQVEGLAAPLLIIKARQGFLACAYVDLATCDTLGEVSAGGGEGVAQIRCLWAEIPRSAALLGKTGRGWQPRGYLLLPCAQRWLWHAVAGSSDCERSQFSRRHVECQGTPRPSLYLARPRHECASVLNRACRYAMDLYTYNGCVHTSKTDSSTRRKTVDSSMPCPSHHRFFYQCNLLRRCPFGLSHLSHADPLEVVGVHSVTAYGLP